jgi:hypothetical protein
LPCLSGSGGEGWYGFVSDIDTGAIEAFLRWGKALAFADEIERAFKATLRAASAAAASGSVDPDEVDRVGNGPWQEMRGAAHAMARHAGDIARDAAIRAARGKP